MNFRGETIQSQPVADWPAIETLCVKYDRFVIEVRKYDSAKEISLQQMKYLHAVVIPALADHVGCSELMAEICLKKKCGEAFFIQKLDGEQIIISKTMLTAKQTTIWLENIWDWMESINCPVPPPDPAWRANKQKEKEQTNGII